MINKSLTSILEQERPFSWWKILDVAIVILSILMVLYQVIYVYYPMQSVVLLENTHLAFGLVITFLVMLRKNHKFWPLKLTFVFLSLICVLYVQIFYSSELAYRISFNTNTDLVIGIILIILSLIACKGAVGWTLPILSVIFILYAFWGHLLSGPFQAVQMSWRLIVSRLALSFGVTGIYGYLLTLSATVIFMFMLFAMLLTATGAVEFFTIIGDWVSQRFKSGPAMAAVFTSALVGSVSGLPGPNVMITGSFTIPAMKKAGYSPEQAGAIEAAASTSGPIIPPVMGVVAFIMVGFTGIPYSTIIVAAILPAILYIFSLAFFVVFHAGKMDIQRLPVVKVDKKELLLRAPLFLGPLIILTVLLFRQYSAMDSAFWAIIVLIAVSLIRPKTRPSFSSFINGFCNAAEIGSKIAVMVAVIGMTVAVISMTGLGIDLPAAMSGLVGNNFLLLLIVTWAIALVLGFGIPTSAAYIMVAITLAPMLVKEGVPLLQAHFFVLYAAVFANLTPPVAIPAIFAAELAGGNYIKTAFLSSFAGMAGFLLPFMIIFVPGLTLNFSGPLFFTIIALIACPLVFIGLQSAIVGFSFKKLNLAERVFVILSPVALMVYIYSRNFVWFLAGIAILGVFIIWQMSIRRRGGQFGSLTKGSGMR